MTRIMTCLVLLIGTSACPGYNKIAKVGDYEITQQDIDRRDEIARVYYPENTSSQGLKQLTDAYIYAEILKKHGRPVTAELLQAEQERIDKQSLMPEMLARIKNIFGKDTESYRRIFVLPIYVDRVLPFEFFPNDRVIHAERLKIATRLLTEVQKDPKHFARIADDRGFTAQTFTVSLHEGLQWKPVDKSLPQPIPGANGSIPAPASVQQVIEEQQRNGASEEGRKWIEEMIKPLSKGSVLPRVIDRDSSWLVARYLEPKPKTKDTYTLEGVLIPKIDFATWVAKEKESIKITVNR